MDNNRFINNNNTEVSNNQKNDIEYQKILENSRRKTDAYWDRNNIFVKLILLGLFVFIAIGVFYYISIWLS